MQAYFQQLRDPSECTAEDGVYVGHMLVDAAETSSSGKRETSKTVRTFAQRTTLLRDCGFPHLATMLATIVTGSHVADPDSPSDGSSDTIADPASVTEEEATAMGVVFVDVLDSGRAATPALTPAAAVLKLMETFVALETMGQQHVWFFPMLTTIAERLQGAWVAERAQMISMHYFSKTHGKFDTPIALHRPSL
jgi:hypothetical protein